MPVFTLVQHEAVTDAQVWKEMYAMMTGSVEWSGVPCHYVVRGEREGSWYPLPLVYATHEERRACAESYALCPSIKFIEETRISIRQFRNKGKMTSYHTGTEWIIPKAYAKLVDTLMARAGYAWDEGDMYITQIIQHLGEDVLYEKVMEAGFTLFLCECINLIEFKSEFTVAGAAHITRDNLLSFAAHCCAMRANDTDEEMGVSAFNNVEGFINRLRTVLADLNS